MARFRLCSGGRVNKICRRTGLRVGRERKETFMIPRTCDLASRAEVGITEIGTPSGVSGVGRKEPEILLWTWDGHDPY